MDGSNFNKQTKEIPKFDFYRNVVTWFPWNVCNSDENVLLQAKIMCNY